MGTNPDLWKYHVEFFRPNSDLDKLIRLAKILCGKYGSELGKVVPTHWMNGLKKIVEKANLPLNTRGLDEQQWRKQQQQQGEKQ